MYHDPIIDEIHKEREEFAARFNYDIRAMGEYFRQLERESGREYIEAPPKPAAVDSTSRTPDAQAA